MRIVYLDCLSGISGNMLLGALLELGVSKEEIASDLAGLGLKDWSLREEKVMRGPVAATLVEVQAGGKQPHRRLQDILGIIDKSGLPEAVRQKSAAVFRRLAEAEAQVHGTTPEKIHFHEVGAVDAIVDVVGAAAGLHRLGIEKVYCSPLPVARGWVKSAHGDLPLPAPAAALLLKGAPTYGVEGETELVSPTGAALVTTLADAFGVQPPMTVEAVGCGAGSADLNRPNFLRAFMGEAKQSVEAHAERLCMIETNIDNMNPELYEAVLERLFGEGALDAYLTPIIMKKSRPGIVLSALCNPQDTEAICRAIFEETSTLGIRIAEIERRCLRRDFQEVETPFGKVKVKIAFLEGKIVSAAPEYEECKRLAAEKGIPARRVYDAAKAAAAQLSTKNS